MYCIAMFLFSNRIDEFDSKYIVRWFRFYQSSVCLNFIDFKLDSVSDVFSTIILLKIINNIIEIYISIINWKFVWACFLSASSWITLHFVEIWADSAPAVLGSTRAVGFFVRQILQLDFVSLFILVVRNLECHRMDSSWTPRIQFFIESSDINITILINNLETKCYFI